MIIAGNFKTHHTRSSTLKFCRELDRYLSSKKDKEVTIFPTLSSLPYNDFAHLKIGAQNAYSAKNGAYSGEVGADQLLELGIKTLLIGHSERRGIFKESNQLVRKKFEFYSNEGFEIFFCIGEDLPTYQSGKTKEFLFSQLDRIDLEYPKLIIAYEPIWAIGSGESAGLEQIEEIHSFLREIGVKTSVYGGSVKPSNAQDIMNLKSVDGVLVGGASLELESFCSIIG